MKFLKRNLKNSSNRFFLILEPQFNLFNIWFLSSSRLNVSSYSTLISVKLNFLPEIKYSKINPVLSKEFKLQPGSPNPENTLLTFYNWYESLFWSLNTLKFVDLGLNIFSTLEKSKILISSILKKAESMELKLVIVSCCSWRGLIMSTIWFIIIKGEIIVLV